ncbi:4-hydroxy-3-methylbut-2-enyl diphosphate reductase [Helicobacter sp. MIT 21-1697]|uniref:4-hydroxy-3-methylbut-2-enyl diphosphate reductase n=1 Tax=Helicobacter sp. MIT 21-1697 TaxID=2993733 RepID=UPI00224B5553|nr:4-hydroxy-3-methylbut-2-enyl diphosphate reductase [Helicobacter sp. MIT 21-1697]MCX2717565.1 4-hydroxy-3-methylbut-2-enyl diphosphate reductase [Helicobacter sp. MIT 21-1697]
MKVKFAKKYGFCFGVKRAIRIAERNQHATTFGPLIHNSREIERLQKDFDVCLSSNLEEAQSFKNVIVRTHGITKDDLQALKEQHIHIVDATCPFVTKPQQIVEHMSKEGYRIIIFGDKNHPEVKGVASYGDDVTVIANIDELKHLTFKKKVALVSQTTKQPEEFGKIAAFLTARVDECRIFNTICSATFENQFAVDELSREVDIMIIVGGKNSSNTKQLFKIAQKYCTDSYLIEDENEIDNTWFIGKKLCGITAGASTPDWIISRVQAKIEQI